MMPSNSKTPKEVSLWASNLSVDQIKNLKEVEITEYASERPGHPGQFGFLLVERFFKSKKHMTEVLRALMKRLQEIKKE